MDVRHQVFLSSTYTDLVEPRRKVIEALLTVDAIPVGMEMFPAADASPMERIKPLIEQSDYYIVLVGNRYGSVLEDAQAAAAPPTLSAVERRRLQDARRFYPRNVQTARKWMLAQWVLLFGMHHFYLGNMGKVVLYIFTFGGLGKWQRADRDILEQVCREADDRDSQTIAMLTGSPARPPSDALPAGAVREREVIREVVKIRCAHCGGLVDQGVPKCGE